MILLHRITSFVIGLVVIIGYTILVQSPDYGWISFLLLVPVVALLFARLLNWDFRHASFWVFLGIPLFFIISSLFFYLFVEVMAIKIGLIAITSLGTWLYAENIFAFYHLPSTYQAYALEYLSLSLYIISGFFFASGAYAAQLFLQLPIWIPALAMFWVMLFATMGIFWVSKIGRETSSRYAIAGAILMTELFLIITLLPNGFLTKAAAFTVFMYVFLGLARVHVLETLSKTVIRNYLITATSLLLMIFLTATWI